MTISRHLQSTCCLSVICLSTVFISVGQTSVHIVLQSTRFISALPGDKVTFDCSMAAGVSVLFWYKQAKGTVGLSLLVFSAGQNQAYIEEPFKTQDSKYAATRPEIKMSTLQINNLETEDSALYYCATSTHQAYFGNGTKLTVLAANVTLPKVKILPPSPKEICSQDKINDKRSTLVCVASGFYPDHVSVSWKVNGVARQDSVSTDTSAQQDKTTLMYHISSRIKVNDTDWMDLKSSFACTVQFFNGDEYTVDISKYIE
uniref:Ig-like domain-containing protein n=1 Tax=Sinocyclocheilus rhinocerous TaxID=307959 RepID=A0A673NK70_9TELE